MITRERDVMTEPVRERKCEGSDDENFRRTPFSVGAIIGIVIGLVPRFVCRKKMVEE
jgi:hypothetical protein